MCFELLRYLVHNLNFYQNDSRWLMFGRTLALSELLFLDCCFCFSVTFVALEA